MTRMLSLRALLAASVCLFPGLALAENDPGFDVDEKPAADVAPQGTNWFTVGGQYSSAPSFYTGRYRGTVSPGLTALGDFHYASRDAWDSGTSRYFEANGTDLGADDRSFSVKLGDQGSWGVWFNYDGIPYYGTNGFQTAYQSTGVLVSGIAPAGLSVSYTQLLAAKGSVNSLWIPTATNSPARFLRSVNISTQRDILSGGGKYQLGDWSITGGWRHEHKDGTYANSAAIGGAPSVTTAGTGATKPTTFTSGLVYFAQPVDYDSDRYDITAAWSTRRLQIQLGYTYSQFTDNVNSFNAQNPFNFFSSTLNTAFGGPVSNVSALYSLPPSNSAHQLKAMLGYNITPTTRLNVNLGYGVGMQDAPYVVGIGNTNVATQTLPRSNFDGLMENYYANIALTAQPLDRLNIRLAYTADDRENHSSQNSYLVFPVSTQNTSFTYLNLPFSYRNQSFSAEAGYRLAPQTKLTVNDTLGFTSRTYADTSQVTTNRVTAKLRGPILDNLFGSISVAHEDRTASNYNAQGWWQQACGGCNVEPKNFLMFFESSRQHDEGKYELDYQPTDNVTVSLFGKVAKDTYPAASLGLRNNNNISVTPDVSWQVRKDLTIHAYYAYQQMFFTQNSIYQSPGAPSIPAPTPTNTQYSVPYQNTTTDSVHTFGLTADWQAVDNVLKFGFDTNISYGDTAYALGEGVVAYGGAITSPTFGPSISMQALPDVKSTLATISVHGEYTFRPNMTVLFGYAFERFNYKDFMTGLSATTYANALLPGSYSPNEAVHVVSAALRVRF